MKKLVDKSSQITSRHAANELLRALPLFAGLAPQDIEIFAAASHSRTFNKGQYLFLEGEVAQSFYVIITGWVKLIHVTESGEEVILAMIKKLSVTGEASLFENGNHESTAQIVEDAIILSLPISLLKSQMNANPRLSMNMMTSMIQYQRRHEMQVEQFLLYSAPQRVGCFILDLCLVQNQRDGFELDLPYDKRLIANLLGMKGPTFSRALIILRDATGTRINGTRVTIVSIKKLLHFVDGCYLSHHVKKNIECE
jgi:CRP-like cAMP-binding protein